MKYFRQQHPGPVIGIIECPKLQAIRESVRALDDFPCVTIPCNARDTNYQVCNGGPNGDIFFAFLFLCLVVLLTPIYPGSWLASDSW